MLDFFSVNNILFTVIGYEMSYIEFFGTLLNILCVWLVVRNNIWTWPIGIAAVVLFAALFYQIQLYSDFVEQIYFLVTGFYGWWIWIRIRKKTETEEEKAATGIKYLANDGRLKTVAVVFGGTVLMGYFMSNIHVYFPIIFPEPAVFPYLDAFTTVLSFTAQILMAHKKTDSWALWIVVDIIGIVLYWVRGVKLVSLLYVLFLALAAKGYFSWRKIMKEATRAAIARA